MNSPKTATQVKFHNWTLQEREGERSHFYFPQLFFSSQDTLKKEFNNWAGGCLGGKVAIYALDPSYVSRIHPKVSNETRKLGLFRLVKNRAKLVCFPTTDPSSELHTRVKSCQKLQKKQAIICYTKWDVRNYRYFPRITYVKISCKFICTFLAQNSP